MTASTMETSPLTTGNAGPSRPLRSRGRTGIVVVLVASLILAGVMRQVADRQQAAFAPHGGSQANSTFGNMDSFALALLLGGLRGPLVMFLWSSSETQKNDKDLEDFDTKVEWIRLLQPEFDSVAIFQIWNKAYNISAMMASPANKYSIIIEALEYGARCDEERPGDVNILNAISNVYSGKLGSSTLPEFAFYSKQFRQESMTDANRAKAFPEEQSRYSRLDKLEPLLDENNRIRADKVTPTRPRPADLAANAEWNDGSELQYLKDYEPFPYGISPKAMGYNYAKRAEVGLSAEKQKLLQLTPMVIDSRPGLELKFWAEDEIRWARSSEAAAFGISENKIPDEIYYAMSTIDPEKIRLNESSVTQSVYFYEMAQRMTDDALREYERHLAKPEFEMRRSTYELHEAELHQVHLMCLADRDFLKACVEKDIAAKKNLLTSASDAYAKAAIAFERTGLRYCTEAQALYARDPRIPGGSVLPPQYPTRDDLDKIPDNLINGIFDKALEVASHLNRNVQDHADERSDYNRTVNRCRLRISRINEMYKKIAG